MRIKILMLGDDPGSLVADGQLLRDRGMLVFTAFNFDNIAELIAEVKPDVLFFDANQQNNLVTETYNNVINSISFRDIPVIITLSEDDVYLITRKRTDTGEKRTIISDSIIGAVKMAMQANKIQHRKITEIPHLPGSHGNTNQAQSKKPGSSGPQLQLPIYFR